MKRIILLSILFFSLTCGIAFAQPINQTDWNTFTITTYYPAPYGVYRNMRLYPSDQPTNGAEPGVMYYNKTENVIKFLSNTTWVNMTGGGGGGWTQNGNNLYTTNTGNNVGIGTTPSPGAKLEVAGQIKITGGSPGEKKVLTSGADGLASWAAGGGGSLEVKAGDPASWPVGKAGDMAYSSDRGSVFFCNGNKWMDMLANCFYIQKNVIPGVPSVTCNSADMCPVQSEGRTNCQTAQVYIGNAETMVGAWYNGNCSMVVSPEWDIGKILKCRCCD
jgi:hypothetical protein